MKNPTSVKLTHEIKQPVMGGSKPGILIKAQRKGGKFLHGSLRKYGNKQGIAQQAIKGKV